jgi:hypothetical protein
VLIIISLILPGLVHAAPGRAAAGDPPTLPRKGYSDETGLVTFIGADHDAPIQIAGAREESMSASDRTLQAVRLYGPQFGIQDPERQLMVKDSKSTAKGRVTVKYQQVYEGVPVFGGELIVNMTNKGELLFWLLRFGIGLDAIP